MRRAILTIALLVTALWPASSISQTRGDLDRALAEINEAIRLDPASPQLLAKRAVIWRAKGDPDRAIADATEAIRLAGATDPAKAKAASKASSKAPFKTPANAMTPAGSELISAYVNRALAFEAKRDLAAARQDYAAALQAAASDAGGRAGQATARVRLSLLSESVAPALAKRTAKESAPAAAPAPAPAQSDAAASRPAAAPAPRARFAAEEKPVNRRVALVIGNSAYSHVRALPNSTNDARSIAKSLRDIGFVVTEGTDLDRTSMDATIRDFLREAARAQVAVVYYAGHGVQVDGRNYLVPVDIQFRAGGGLTDTMMDLEMIMAGLDDQARTNILILDACRNNPMAPRLASTGPTRDIEGGSGLAAPTTLGAGATPGAGMLIAFATAPGQVALDGEGANSPFSAALTRHIGTKGLEVQQMLTRVRADVVAATKGKQVPWSNSSLLGDVYLAEK